MTELISDREARKYLRAIIKMYPNSEGSLLWDTRFHLLCAVLMSAQTTDRMVNRIMPEFTEKFPTAFELSQASISDIEAVINRLGLYHSKAEHLRKMAKQLVKEYDGQVPDTMEALTSLAGVGEKTASVVLSDGFKIPQIAVDTHITRITKAFKMVPENADAHEIKLYLQNLMPKKEWIELHHALIYFGRNNYPARKKHEDPRNFIEAK
ncbi:MAG: endonuclease III [Lactobacillus sp.]|nr:endonuclease III [Lactobacillus sp.]